LDPQTWGNIAQTVHNQTIAGVRSKTGTSVRWLPVYGVKVTTAQANNKTLEKLEQDRFG